MNKKKNIVMVTMLAVVALMSIAYAYFAANLSITSTGSISSSWDVKFINITNDTPVGSASNLVTPSYTATTATMSADLKLPGDSITYRITLKNNGDIPAIIEDIDASATGSGAIIFSMSGLNIGEKLAGGAEKEIVVKIEYDPLTTSQPAETTKTLTVSIKAVQDTGQVIDSVVPGIDQPITSHQLSYKILNDNDEQLDTTIDISKSSRYIASYKEIHSEIAESVSMALSSTYYYGSGYTFDAATGYYKLTGTTTGKWSTMSTKYATYPYTCKYTYDNRCSTLYKMTGYTSATQGTGHKYTNEAIYSENGKGLYYTSTNTENNQHTYYFRGDVDNNYVKFGIEYKTPFTCTVNGQTIKKSDGSEILTEEECTQYYGCVLDGEIVGIASYPSYCYYDYNGADAVAATGTYGAPLSISEDIFWRIVRINEDGSVRLIYQGKSPDSTGADSTIGSSWFNEEQFDNAYVGYMYGAAGQSGDNAYKLTHSNDNPSTIKAHVDDWYTNNTNLPNYRDSYLADAGFCNDRSIYSGLGYGINYTVYGTGRTQFACPQSNDLFTTSTSSKGNKALTNPIGLITQDEVQYAGTSNSYLDTGYAYYTMTPALYDVPSEALNIAVNYLVTSGGSLSSDYHDGGCLGVRPVINVKGNVDVELTGTGEPGTATNPYIIKTN